MKASCIQNLHWLLSKWCLQFTKTYYNWKYALKFVKLTFLMTSSSHDSHQLAIWKSWACIVSQMFVQFFPNNYLTNLGFFNFFNTAVPYWGRIFVPISSCSWEKDSVWVVRITLYIRTTLLSCFKIFFCFYILFYEIMYLVCSSSLFTSTRHTYRLL